ncbi:response regulator, partial [Candidatus Omnitrophota bacterium]
ELARAQEFSVVLLDIDMPVMTGIDTLPKLLEIDPKLGVVMVTGNQEDEKVKKAMELGACGYVLKPFDFSYLELVVMSKLAIAEGS